MKKLFQHPLLFGTVFLIVAIAGLYGCKDFLASNAAPQGSLNEQTLQTREGVEGTLIAAYRALDANYAVLSWGNAASNWVFGSVASDDAYKGSEKDDQPPIQDIEGYHWSSQDANGYLNDKWNGMYEGIVRANSTIRLLREVIAGKPSEFNCTGATIGTCDVNAAGILGEALFLRAHYHFEAWRMWGSIPYYRADDVDFRKPNVSPAQVATELLVDLDSAIALLGPVYGLRAPGDKGRANVWTAKAYKGRVQTYAASFGFAAATWGDALTTLRDVQANGPYALQPSFDQVWSGFQAYSNGPETIFAYQASVNDGEPNGANSNWGERLNFPHSGSPFGCCGFHQPSQNLVNFYRVDVNGLPLSISAPNTWNTNNATFAGGNLAAVDPRIDFTVGRDNVPYKDWGLHEPGWIRAPAFSGPYSPKKNAHEKASGAESNVGWVPTQTNSVNIHLYRYADMLLMLAEAEVEAGVPDNAITIVNQIRARAGVKVQGCGDPTDASLAGDKALEDATYPTCAGDTRIAVPLGDPSVVWANYQIGQYPQPFAGTQAQAREIVRTERRLELAMEGQRFFDLRRWGFNEALVTGTAASEVGGADQVINAYLTGVGGGDEQSRRTYLQSADAWVGATDRHYWYPIPAQQIDLSKVGTAPQLKQNTGW